MTRRLLLDTSSLGYRAFFALPTSITAPGGQCVNAVRGYLDMTATLVRTRRPDEILHCLDHDWRPAPRVAAYSGYKATRNADPAELAGQFELLGEVLEAFGQAQVEAPGWEADDVIGTLCTAAADGDETDIVTGDRDLLQLVRDGETPVRVLFTVRGVKDLAVFDERAVRERYGVPPQRYVDFAILRGDPSDGLPGLKGVGEKTARDLVRAYPTLEALVDDALAHPPRLARCLRESREYLLAMAEVVPVRTDVALRRRSGERDDARLDALGAEWNLESPIRRLQEALDG